MIDPVLYMPSQWDTRKQKQNNKTQQESQSVDCELCSASQAGSQCELHTKLVSA